MSHSARVLVVGLDGATYDMLTPLVERGALPNLARFMQSAALAECRSTAPCITPAAWTTFQTGTDVAQHGIVDYRYLDHARGQLALNNATRIGCPTLFQTLAEAGHEVVSLNLPMTYPPAANVAGLVVGGLDSPSISAALAPYPRFSERLRASGTRFDLSPVWRRVPQDGDELAAAVAETRQDFRGRAAAARLADGFVDWRLMFVQFQTLDALQHRCWHLLGLEGDSPRPTWTSQIYRALKALDDALGELLELAQRRGASVMMVSDHGFGRFRGKVSVPELLRRRGLWRPAGAGDWLRHMAARTALMGRKWLQRRQRHGASTASVLRPPQEVLPTDWRRSPTVALHGDLAGLVYLNTPERFGPQSCAALGTPRLREEATAAAIAAFQEARHPETGERLFVDAWSTAERWNCDPLSRSLPDVVAIPADGFHTRTKYDGGRRLLSADSLLSGTHRMQGVLMLSSPGAASGQRFSAELRDAAPTILRMLHLAPAPTMTGRVLEEMLGDSQDAHPLPARGLKPALRPAPEPALSADQQQVVEQRLRDLGYLD
ncbi:MAG: alkaline phosphatase family protein [Pirellulales bacterium]